LNNSRPALALKHGCGCSSLPLRAAVLPRLLRLLNLLLNSQPNRSNLELRVVLALSPVRLPHTP
jgi:hypothetical protein